MATNIPNSRNVWKWNNRISYMLKFTPNALPLTISYDKRLHPLSILEDSVSVLFTKPFGLCRKKIVRLFVYRTLTWVHLSQRILVRVLNYRTKVLRGSVVLHCTHWKRIKITRIWKTCQWLCENHKISRFFLFFYFSLFKEVNNLKIS